MKRIRINGVLAMVTCLLLLLSSVSIGGESSSRLVNSTRVFDVVVSLYNDPSGDNDPTTFDDRTPYEEILGHFADAVYEATEGAHKIGTISVYTKGSFADVHASSL